MHGTGTIGTMKERSKLLFLLTAFATTTPTSAILHFLNPNDVHNAESAIAVSRAAYRRKYDRPNIESLEHGRAHEFDFGRFQSPEAVDQALSKCRHNSAFKRYRGKDGRNGHFCSTRLGGDWVLAESKQLAPACTAADVLAAYLSAENQKRWNADKVHNIKISRAGPGRYKQEMVLKSQRIITSHMGIMRYTQTIRVDQIGSGNYNAFVRLDPNAKSNTKRRPFDSLAVNVSLRQKGDDVVIYAAGIMRVNRSVVPNLIVFDASGIAGNMAGKGTLWLSTHFERKQEDLQES